MKSACLFVFGYIMVVKTLKTCVIYRSSYLTLEVYMHIFVNSLSA